MANSDVYSLIVKDDNDVAGQVAYVTYKRTRTEFIKKMQNERRQSFYCAWNSPGLRDIQRPGQQKL